MGARNNKEAKALAIVTTELTRLESLNSLFSQMLSTHDRSPLQRLDIHVHSYEAETPMILDRCWLNLVRASPHLQVGLALLHSYEAVQNLLLILRPSMPLTHFK